MTTEPKRISMLHPEEARERETAAYLKGFGAARSREDDLCRDIQDLHRVLWLVVHSLPDHAARISTAAEADYERTSARLMTARQLETGEYIIRALRTRA